MTYEHKKGILKFILHFDEVKLVQNENLNSRIVIFSLPAELENKFDKLSHKKKNKLPILVITARFPESSFKGRKGTWH